MRNITWITCLSTTFVYFSHLSPSFPPRCSVRPKCRLFEALLRKLSDSFEPRDCRDSEKLGLSASCFAAPGRLLVPSSSQGIWHWWVFSTLDLDDCFILFLGLRTISPFLKKLGPVHPMLRISPYRIEDSVTWMASSPSSTAPSIDGKPLTNSFHRRIDWSQRPTHLSIIENIAIILG